MESIYRQTTSATSSTAQWTAFIFANCGPHFEYGGICPDPGTNGLSPKKLSDFLPFGSRRMTDIVDRRRFSSRADLFDPPNAYASRLRVDDTLRTLSQPSDQTLTMPITWLI